MRTVVGEEKLGCPDCDGQGGTDGYDQSGEPTHSKATCSRCEGTGEITRPTSVSDDERFCAVVWDALKSDHNDLRKQQIILEAHRAARSASGLSERVRVLEETGIALVSALDASARSVGKPLPPVGSGDEGMVEKVRSAIVASIIQQTNGQWPVAEYDERIVVGLVDAHLDFIAIARAAIAALSTGVTNEKG